MDPDQTAPLVPHCLSVSRISLMVFLKEFFEKVDLKKISRQKKKHEKLPRMQSCHHGRISDLSGSALRDSKKIPARYE